MPYLAVQYCHNAISVDTVHCLGPEVQSSAHAFGMQQMIFLHDVLKCAASVTAVCGDERSELHRRHRSHTLSVCL